MPEGKLKGRCTSIIFKAISCSLKTYNQDNYLKAVNCYKIITYDPMDDTIDEFGNLVTGVVAKLAKTDYTTE